MDWTEIPHRIFAGLPYEICRRMCDVYGEAGFYLFFSKEKVTGEKVNKEGHADSLLRAW